MDKNRGYENHEKPDGSHRSEISRNGIKHFLSKETDDYSFDSRKSKDKPISTTDPEWLQRQLDDARKSGYLPLLSGDHTTRQLIRDQTSETDAGDKTKLQDPDRKQANSIQHRQYDGPSRLLVDHERYMRAKL